MDKTITAAEANRGFSHLLRAVRQGESYLVTVRGNPVARIIPASAGGDDREAAKQRLLDHLRAQPTQNLGRWSRDELYDD